MRSIGDGGPDVCVVQDSVQPPIASRDDEATLLAMEVPVFLPVDDDSRELLNVAPRIECRGAVIAPTGDPLVLAPHRAQRDFQAPDGATVALLPFTIELGPRLRDADMLLTYTQPTVGGALLYPPLFEKPNSRRRKEDFRLTVVSADPGIALNLVEGEASPLAGRVECSIHKTQPISTMTEERTDGNQALQTAPVTRSGFGKGSVRERLARPIPPDA